MKNLFYKFYIVGFMALTVWFIVIIWKVTFAHIIEEYHTRKEAIEIAKIKQQQEGEMKKSTFQKLILEGDERVKVYLGYKILEEKRIKGHFHHIGFDIGPDKRSHCIMCHGDMPHDNLKELRAFLNMHAFFVSCQTCHMRLEGTAKTGIYKWYDRASGEIVDSPVKKARPGSYVAKIIPFERVNGQLERIDSQDKIDFALEFKDKEKTLTEAQRSKAKKMIHQVVNKQPYVCEDCHRKDSPLLPFSELGYPKERIDSLTSTEVVGMIKNYTQFYMPRMLHPGETAPKEIQRDGTESKPTTLTLKTKQ
ncbi:MAG: hypothetical protein C4538_12305 [Nitrospiraceae bacterium]|nr:MAG: hypothetical protein C4538_12305 [Nitrospiraceae bacterium]